jgi:hypothetical protein
MLARFDAHLRLAIQGPSVVVGAVGCFPGSLQLSGASITGINYASSSPSKSAQSALASLFADITGRALSYGTAIPSELSSKTFVSGVYYSPSYVTLGAQLTFDALGDADAVFIIAR